MGDRIDSAGVHSEEQKLIVEAVEQSDRLGQSSAVLVVLHAVVLVAGVAWTGLPPPCQTGIGRSQQALFAEVAAPRQVESEAVTVWESLA